MHRIQDRARSVEQSINIEYLSMLNEAIGKEVDAVRDKIKVLEIDSGVVDFTNDEKIRDSIALHIIEQIK